MAQNDFSIANQGFPSFRSDLNDALQSLASNSSGTTAPPTTYAYQWWYDETNDILKIRNSANDAWVDFATFDQTTNSLSFNATNLTRDGSQVYSRDNILGTVSESTGTPTGAVIENGSNANGEYTRFADGTQICSILSLELTHNPANVNAVDGSWTYPVSFVSTTGLQVIGSFKAPGTGVSALQLGTIETNNVTETQSGCRIWRDPSVGTFSSGDTAFARVIAYGRWY